MRIVIRSWPSTAGAQWRAYAEYRVFCRLAAMAEEIASVRVAVYRAADGATRCAMTASLEYGGRTRGRSRRHEPSGAIDAAVDELAAATSRRLEAAGRGALSPRARTASSCARGSRC